MIILKSIYINIICCGNKKKLFISIRDCNEMYDKLNFIYFNFYKYISFIVPGENRTTKIQSLKLLKFGF